MHILYMFHVVNVHLTSEILKAISALKLCCPLEQEISQTVEKIWLYPLCYPFLCNH